MKGGDVCAIATAADETETHGVCVRVVHLVCAGEGEGEVAEAGHEQTEEGAAARPERVMEGGPEEREEGEHLEGEIRDQVDALRR